MVDRTTKVLMFAIALGLWMNVATQWLKPTSAYAQQATATTLEKMHEHISNIAWGHCGNPKICR